MKMTEKINVAVLFGGRSGEHEVSLLSARSVLSVIDRNKYNVTPIGITKQGQWLLGENVIDCFEKNDTASLLSAFLLPEPGKNQLFVLRNLSGQTVIEPFTTLDVIFPVMHGTFGEDGTLQGMLELASIAYVGAGVLGSSASMDKQLFKDVMKAHQIPVIESILFTRSQIESEMETCIEKSEALSDYPLFTKPANLGSSVGINKCHNRTELIAGLKEAAEFDRRILVEKGINHPREIEVSVLGNDAPIASIPGEIEPADDFYSYNAKYYDDRSKLYIPAELSPEQLEKIQQYALTAYQAADCAGMARVDFLIDENEEIYLSEINTLPGFTQISMYPKLWEASGLPYPQLIDRLIELAIERRKENDRSIREYRRKA